jgi:hypothetical protein
MASLFCLISNLVYTSRPGQLHIKRRPRYHAKLTHHLYSSELDWSAPLDAGHKWQLLVWYCILHQPTVPTSVVCTNMKVHIL